jgi:NAD(P)-dependent dehydrogenase (short-subunit alcohol dehydrogenase family)
MVVVITGASAGVGRATAREFGRRGDAVALLGRNEDGLRSAAREVEEVGGHALAIPTDVADFAQVEAAAERATRELGAIDVWVNVAMASILAPTWDIDPSEFRRVTEVTYLGAVHGTQAALRRMLPRDRGKIVQVGSALGFRGIPLQATYCASKHAVQGFVESLRTELRHRGSNVSHTIVQLPGLNTTQFGWVRARTPDFPQPVAPIYAPEVAARAIVWAATHTRAELWVGLPTVYTIMGSRMASRVADIYLARTGFKGQQSGTPLDPDRPDYLDSPLDDTRDYGSDGPFGDKSHRHSAQLWVDLHRGPVLGALAGAAAAGLTGWLRSR